jgi:glycosyltransferase involved in cell wall biosynthesis
MRLLYCVQRYGEDIAGGSEAACRAVAEHMATRDHEVEVLTSCAKSYVDWADHFPEGTSHLNGVRVHRLPVRENRSPEKFGPMHRRLLMQPCPPLFVQRDWLRIQGPDIPKLGPWINENAPRFDAAIFFTYLYPTTAFGLPIAAKHCPTVLVPTAHDEPMLQFRVFDQSVRRAHGLICLTPEELALIERRFRFVPDAEVIGIGLDPCVEADPSRFRDAFELGQRPYLVVLGRVDPGKGADQLVRFFREYKLRYPSELALVVVGEPVAQLEPHPDVVLTGFVDHQTKVDGIAGATLLVQPSYFESFSLALCEAWLAEKPAIVQGRCEVLAGQSARSGGGLPYTSFAEFTETLTRLLEDESLRREMGKAGRRFVIENYAWDDVLDAYEAFLSRMIATHARRDPTEHILKESD